MTDDGRLDIGAIHRLVNLDPPMLRRGEVAEMGGVPSDDTIRWWRAMGFPELPDGERAFSTQDVDMVRQLNSLLVVGLVDDEDILRLARLMGASFSRLADAQIAVIDEFLASLPGADPEQSRRTRLSALVASPDTSVLDFLEDSMVYVWRRHLLAAIGRWISVDDDTTEQAVGFADLSGFSRLTKRVSATDLADTIEAFEAAAFDVVSSHEGRVVKLIGDEVMFVTPDLDEGVAIAIDLVHRLDGVDIVPPVHCGVAFGPTVTVGGDVFGPTVNLASRLTEVARPGTIAIDRDAGGAIRDREDLHVRRVRRHYDLKGVGRTSVLLIRPTEPATRS
ncbi:MAG: adenylate/guanylate cyclase domain-containing protein [Acidimicrobiales bacterium]